MSKLSVERVSFDTFWEGFEEEFKMIFSDYLHTGFSPLYSEGEKDKRKNLKVKHDENFDIYLIAKKDGEIIGRSFSERMNKDTLIMCMSYVMEEKRKQGVYSTMLDKTIELAKQIGYLKILSGHNTSNNEIIIPKLKKGFVISGLKVNAGYGTLVDLTLFLSKTEEEMQNFRCGFRKPSENLKRLLSL